MPNIVVFFGAGVSNATFELPSMIDLYQNFSAYLRNAGREYRDHNFFYEEILEIIGAQTPQFEQVDIDIETVLTVLTDLANYYIKKRFNHPTILYLLKRDRLEKRFESLFADTQKMYANIVLSFMKEFIVKSCDIKTKSGEEKKKAFDLYYKFFEGIMELTEQLNYFEEKNRNKQNIESATCDIFTTNYDQCLEFFCRDYKIEKNNGEEITGSGEGYVNLLKKRDNNLYEGKKFQIYKLHGSINWYKTKNDDNIRWSETPIFTGSPTAYGRKESEFMIYPVTEKNIFRDPFSDMFLTLKEKLSCVDICIIAGYSFRDNEISDIFYDALKRNDKNVKILLFDPNAENIAKRLPELGNVKVKNIPHQFDNEGLEKFRLELGVARLPHLNPNMLMNLDD